MSRKRPRSSSPSSADGPDPNHQSFRSGAVKDRGSTFIALFSPTAPTEDLQDQSDFKTATHRIAAWRKLSAQRALLSGPRHRLFDTGHDDDGEQYAGKRLEKVLTELNVVGAVVVARWYGGILLGPARFTHIENCAREAIEKWRMSTVTGKEEVDHPAAQKRKLVDNEARRSALVRVLEERDHSISVLRGLLQEKTEEAAPVEMDGKYSSMKDAAVTPTTVTPTTVTPTTVTPTTVTPTTVTPTAVTPTKAPNYSTMALPALERLEKARDATISWILKEIEKVEEKQQQQQQQQGIPANDCG
jgi:putative IMPACT (imprinted ancient) family translation regulator